MTTDSLLRMQEKSIESVVKLLDQLSSSEQACFFHYLPRGFFPVVPRTLPVFGEPSGLIYNKECHLRRSVGAVPWHPLAHFRRVVASGVRRSRRGIASGTPREAPQTRPSGSQCPPIFPKGRRLCVMFCKGCEN